MLRSVGRGARKKKGRPEGDKDIDIYSRHVGNFGEGRSGGEDPIHL